jgi:hypothetical protein
LRDPTDQQNAKLAERPHKDFFDFSGVRTQETRDINLAAMSLTT